MFNVGGQLRYNAISPLRGCNFAADVLTHLTSEIDRNRIHIANGPLARSGNKPNHFRERLFVLRLRLKNGCIVVGPQGCGLRDSMMPSHSAQGLTAERVLIHADTSVHPDLLSARFGYVAVSRASHEATIFTDDVTRLGQQLSTEVSRTSALEIDRSQSISQDLGIA